MVKQLTEEQISVFREVFSLYDEECDETIHTKSLGIVLQSLGQNLNKDELKAITHEVDPNGHGVINFHQFLVLMARHLKEEAAESRDGEEEEKLREAFRIFDHDDSGFISEADLRHLMTKLGENLTDEEISEMVSQADKDHDGQVSYAEFLTVVPTKKPCAPHSRI